MLGRNKAKNNEAKEQIVSQWYREYSRLLLKKSYEILGDYHMAKDMVQETFIKIIKNFEKVNNLSEAARSVYFVSINKTVCLDYIRKYKTEEYYTKKLSEDKYVSNMNPIAIDIYANSELLVDLERGLAQLQERDVILIIAKYVWSMSEKEIAELLGIKPQNVHSYVKRATDRLIGTMSKEV